MLENIDNLDGLFVQLKGCLLGKVKFDLPISDVSESIQSVFQENGIAIEPSDTIFPDLVTFRKFSDVDFVNFLEEFKPLLLEHGASVTFLLVLSQYYESRDSVVETLVPLGNRNFSIRAVAPLGKHNTIWVTVKTRNPVATIVTGDGNLGKTNYSIHLSNSMSKILHGDSILEQISTNQIPVSNDLFEIVNSGYKIPDWSFSIDVISKNLGLREEFALTVCDIAGDADVVFEMWMPRELLESIISRFLLSGFIVWLSSRMLQPGEILYRDELTQQRDELTQQRDELTQQRDELTQQRDELTQQRDELTLQRDELTLQRDELLNSTIWKATKPIRWFVNLIKR